ncbi:hypothetical protein BX667DRAFT_474357 [Coemansia mojavensis]|nr:hypothetical protein BX667DRAFT_474357 [Coemansia mojavensis]
MDLRAIDFNFTVEQINRLAEEATNEYNAILDKVAKQPRPTFENTIVPLARWYNEITELVTASGLRYFHPDKQICDASAEADNKFMGCVIEGYMRLDVYKAVRYVYDDQEEMIMLSAEDKRLVETIERQFRKNGLQISSKKRALLSKAKKRLVQLEDEYALNSAACSYVLFTREELDGVSENDIAGMAVVYEDGVEKHAVSTNVFVYNRVMRYAKREETRKRLYVACGKESLKNIAYIQEAVELRLEIAKLLGYESHAESVFEGRMVKSADEIIDMYEELRRRLSKHIDAEMDRLTAVKKADMLAEGREYTGFFEWDYYYYSYVTSEKKRDMFEIEGNQYFPIIEIGCKLIDIFEGMLGLYIIPAQEPNVWHPDVEMFEVWEADESEFIGHLYLDLYTRESKRETFTTFSLRRGCQRPDGSREFPAVIVNAVFPKPTEDKPTRLSFDNLEMLMVLFGQAFATLCESVKWRDLLEPEFEFHIVPGEIMRRWIYEPTVLQQLGSHYLTGETIPDQLIKGPITDGTEVTPGELLIPITFDLHDLLIHSATDKPVDVKQAYYDLCKQVPFMRNNDTGVFHLITHRYLMAGYDTGMYVYLWSSIISEDIYWSRFRKNGLYNRKTGREYRNEILRPAGSRSASVSLERFLGRQPSTEAFYKNKFK